MLKKILNFLGYALFVFLYYFSSHFPLSHSQITYKYIILDDLQQLNPIINFFDDIYAKNSLPSDKHYAICKRYASITTMTIKVGIVLYSMTSVMITLSGNFEWVATGYFRPAMYIYLPHIHEYSRHAYMWLMAYNYVMAVACFLLIPPGDMLFFIVFANVPMAPAVMQGQLEEFEVALDRGRNDEVRTRMLQFIQMLDRYNRYISRICAILSRGRYYYTGKFYSFIGTEEKKRKNFHSS